MGAASSNIEGTTGSTYHGLGAAAILPAFSMAFLQNGLTEELFFRGFLVKRISARMGKILGFLLPSILFGLMHNILFYFGGAQIGLNVHITMFFANGVGGLLLTVLNEKLFNGSIFPSVILHGLGNFIAFMNAAFLLW